MPNADVQPTFASPEWVDAYFDQHGFYPIAGGAPEGEGAEGGGGDDGQGEGGGSGGLYDLDSVPEQYREFVEPHLKAVEANATKKFQEAAEYRKQWEPYEQLGLNDVPPEQLEQLLAFAELAQDETAFEQWWRETGDRLGFGSDDASDDLDLDLDDDLSPDKIKELIAESLEEHLAPIQETLSASEEERAEQEALAEIKSVLDRIKEEDAEADTEAIVQLAYAYVDDDPDNAIQRGYEDYRKLIGKGESALFAQKSGQPKTPEGGGGAPATQPKQITTFEEAKEAAKERFAAARGT